MGWPSVGPLAASAEPPAHRESVLFGRTGRRAAATVEALVRYLALLLLGRAAGACLAFDRFSPGFPAALPRPGCRRGACPAGPRLVK